MGKEAQARSARSRWLRRSSAAVALLLVFAVALAGGAVLHLNLLPSRILLRRGVNWLLAGTFEGRVEVQEIESVGLSRTELAGLTATAPDGTRVLTVEEIEVRGPSLLAVIRTLLGSSSAADSSLAVPLARVERVAVRLDRDADGELLLARAFKPRDEPEPEEPEPDEPPSEPSRRVFAIERIAIEHIELAGQVAADTPLQVQLEGLEAALRRSEQDGLQLDVSRVGLVERSLGKGWIAGAVGPRLSGTLALSLHSQPPLGRQLGASFRGRLGDLAFTVLGALDGDQIAASVELPQVGPAELQPLLGQQQPLTRTAAAVVSVSGTLPSLTVGGQVAFKPDRAGDPPPGRLRLSGRLLVGEPLLLDLRAAAEAIDTSVLRAVAKPSSITLGARLKGRIAGGDPELLLQLDGRPSQLSAVAIPPWGGTVEATRSSVDARLEVSEPGLPIAASVVYQRDQGARFALRADAPSLAAVPRLAALLEAPAKPEPPPVTGRASLTSRGSYAGGKLDVAVAAELSRAGLPRRKLRLARGRLQGRLRGAPAELEIDVTASGWGLRIAQHQIDAWLARAVGPVKAPTVELHVTDLTDRHLAARAEVVPDRALVKNLSVSLRRGDVELSGRVAQIAGVEGGVRIDGIDLKGLDGGHIEGSLAIVDRDLTGRLETGEIRLDALSKLLGLRDLLDVTVLNLRGAASVSVDLQHTPQGRQGHVKVAVKDGGALVISGVQAELGAEIRDGKALPFASIRLIPNPDTGDPADGAADPCSGAIAALLLSTVKTSKLRGPLLDSATWLGADAELALSAPGLKLPCLAQLWTLIKPGVRFPFRDLAGVVRAQVVIERGAGERTVSLKSAELESDGFRLEGHSATGDAEGEPAWLIENLDLAASAKKSAAAGTTEVQLQLLDASKGAGSAGKPVLAALGAVLEGDLARFLKPAERRRERLLQLPLAASLELPRRKLEELAVLPGKAGEVLRTLQGEASLLAFLEGTLEHPQLALRVRGWGFAPKPSDEPPSSEPGWVPPLDLDIIGSYQPDDGQSFVSGSVRLAGAQTVATFEATADGDLAARWVRPEAPPPTFTGSLTARLRQLPLEAIPKLAASEVTGQLSGFVDLKDLGKLPQVTADLQLSQLKLGPLSYEASLALSPSPAHPRSLLVDGNIGIAGGGSFAVAGYGGLAWDEAGLRPSPDKSLPAALLVTADRFPLRSLQPLLADAGGKVDGELNGSVHLSWKETATQRAALKVNLGLSGGLLYLPQIGQEIHSVAAHAHSQGSVVKVDGITLSGATGRATGAVQVTLRDDLTLAELRGRLAVKEGEELSLTHEGISAGSARGVLDLVLRDTAQGLDAELQASQVHLLLPASARAGVQELADHPDVTYVRRGADGSVQPLANAFGRDEVKKDAKRSSLKLHRLVVKLLDTEIEGAAIRLGVATEPKRPIVVTKDGVTGQVLLTKGSFSLLGKRFELSQGAIVLSPDRSAPPYLTLTASWNAPDSTVVYLEYNGPLRAPLDRDSIRFRSEPPRAEEAVLALILLGEQPVADDASGGQAAQQQAANLTRGIAAAQLNQLLGEGISTQVGTTQDGLVATSVSYQVNSRLTAHATLERGSAQGSEVTGASQQDQLQRTTVGFDWRFHPKLLLRTTLGWGDAASSGVDILFQHRY